ncbi:DUF5318 family protein [uncultured Corynebacterium sp.]|uniref:DUF5318 family protein n=1 Tax=uncultured Corynebacterium sp. TaxID=159447 RepID=UPI0025CD62A3|nr:DUF5318 family protein [uncultured Corynebacterium sp.]
MIRWRDEVDHTLARNAELARWRDGEVPAATLRDADPRLIAAARFHGEPAATRCPLCRFDDLRLVSWVFGENLGHRSGTACGAAELSALVAERGPCTVQIVEVCPDCRWNFRVRTATAEAAAAE